MQSSAIPQLTNSKALTVVYSFLTDKECVKHQEVSTKVSNLIDETLHGKMYELENKYSQIPEEAKAELMKVDLTQTIGD